MQCDNCGNSMSIKLSYKNGKCIMEPYIYTTNYGGKVCGTGCAMSYINKKEALKYVGNPNSGMHVQWENNRTIKKNT